MRLADPARDAETYLALEQTAAEPYLRFVYDSLEAARAVSQFLWSEGAGEVVPPYGALAIDDDGAPIAMLAMLDRAELATARIAAARALIRGKQIGPTGPTRERLMLASATLLTPEDDDYYLSRIAVSPTARRRGVGRWLLGELENAGRSRGKRRLVLEVSPEHSEAIALYERAGFSAIGEQRAVDPNTSRALVYRHMAKSLA